MHHLEQAQVRHDQLFCRPQRVAPLNRTEHADEIISATTRLKNAVSGADGPPVPLEHCPDMVATLMRYPKLWDRLSLLSAQLQSADATLPVRVRQLAIMRTVWLCGAPYQWGEHLARTKLAGVSEAEIERLQHGSDGGDWKPFDRAVIAAVDDYHSDHFVSEATWIELAAQLDESQLVELLVLIGQFASVAFVLNSLRMRLEPHNKGFLTI